MPANAKFIDFETRSIEPIPLDERKGKARDLFSIWFGFNMIPLTLVTGAIGISLNLSFVWAVVAIVVGNLLGGLTMALHASQGPHLGVPQMLQARGQFGAHGANILVLITLFIMVGYFTSNLVVSAQALTLAIPAIPPAVGIAVATVASLLVTAAGYTMVRRVSASMAWLVGAVAVVLLVTSLLNSSTATQVLSAGHYSTVGFFTICMVAASWQVGYAPYVSDYSRYLPPNSGERQAFWGTYAGCVTGAALMMVLGAYLGGQVSDASPLTALHSGYGAIGLCVLALFFVASALTNTVNAYTATLCSLTLLQGLRPGRDISLRTKFVAMAALHVLGFAVAVAASGDFLTYFLNFIYFLLYLLVPWSAINLADYFLVRHGDYDIASFFVRGGGVYGRWNGRALSAYVIGIAVQLPFINTALLVGPLVANLGGVDIAWIIGFVFSGLLYVALTRVGNQRPRPAHTSTGAVSSHRSTDDALPAKEQREATPSP